MESIGEKLRATREEKNLSIDQVARDTNIAKRYILALEDEAFSDFPGEPYLVGFLRNYSDYLGLDAEEIVGLYKNFKIQEQPLPMEELLEPRRRRRGPLVVLLVVVVAALIVAGVLFLPQVLSKGGGQVPAPTAKATTSSGTEYQLKDEIVERRFVAGDTVVVPVGNKSYKVKLSVSGRELVLTDASGTQTVKLGEEKSIDLNGDGTPDLKVFLRDVDTQDPAKGIIVRFDRFTQSPSVPSGSQAAAASTGGASSSGQTGAGSAAQAASSAAVASAPAREASAPQASSEAVPTITPQSSQATGPVVIMSNSATTPFTVDINFTGNCLFRYLIDGQGEDQRYFQKGEATRLDVQQDVEIWASNGGAMNVTVGSNQVDMGNPGEVVARKIAWVQDEGTTGYQLEMTRMP